VHTGKNRLLAGEASRSDFRSSGRLAPRIWFGRVAVRGDRECCAEMAVFGSACLAVGLLWVVAE
jgi:hypothetical protein